MPRKLTNKQIVVLRVVRNHPEGVSSKRVAEEVVRETPCGHCNGTGEGDGRDGRCDPCYGRGQRWFSYSDAYQALQRLRKVGLVDRRVTKDEWGDDTLQHVYFAVCTPTPDPDPLQELFDLPSAEVNR